MKASNVLRTALKNQSQVATFVRPIRLARCSQVNSFRVSHFHQIKPQVRHATTYSSASNRLREAIIKARSEHPVLFPTLLIATLGAVSFLGLLAYDEYTRVAPQYAAYPRPVEQRLRVALHFTHVQPDPAAASEAFIEAIKAADACGMDPFSKESLGIRIRYSEMLEKYGRMKAAIEVLSNITKDCEEKLAEIDRDSVGGGATDQSQKRTTFRKGLLRTIIQTKVKVSSLYESDYIQDSKSAKQILSDAIGLLVKETKNPEESGFSEDNAAGFSLAEIAAMLSQMGDLYATSGEEANAVQVYMLTLQPLRAACNGTRSCKEVQVLSNIASTMTLAMKKPNAKINGKPVTKSSLAAARKATIKWAEQAIATADAVNPQDRDEICELGLLSAQMTYADLLLDNGDKAKSREVFTSLLPTLRQKGLTTLVKIAEDGLNKTKS